MNERSREIKSGTDLKVARIRRGVRAVAVARRLEVSKQRVSAIEASAHPTRAAVARYLAALEAEEAIQ